MAGLRLRGRISPVAIIVLSLASALVVNLAANTLDISWPGWPRLVWIAAGVLLVASVVVEWRRSRAQERPPVPVRVFGAVPELARHFQSRPEQAEQLGRVLRKRKGQTAQAVLLGQRGAGKTQLAAAHARRCAEDGDDLVAWINAESGPVADLALLAIRLGLAGQDQSRKRWPRRSPPGCRIRSGGAGWWSSTT